MRYIVANMRKGIDTPTLSAEDVPFQRILLKTLKCKIRGKIPAAPEVFLPLKGSVLSQKIELVAFPV